ncbi:GNAT family N-acetyltransferase [Neobacillus drentensis]|uniref:GNAT family N-acetyltransferase n=1 Tax=Neobacillus drentensis TaxID=220684 RepID=UPI0008241E0E|nr:GNAT family N-acetyltransferase [Neobacillus drentensis]
MEIYLIGLEKLKEVKQFYSVVTSDLRKKGVYQWDRFYPNRFVIKTDLKKGSLFGIQNGNKVIGAITLNTDESKKYRRIDWEDKKGTPLIIHRLAVHPSSQGKGYGKLLLQFAEKYALDNGFSSIRLDVFSQNPGALNMYERAGFQQRGIIRYPFRSVPYKCLEKVLG